MTDDYLQSAPSSIIRTSFFVATAAILVVYPFVQMHFNALPPLCSPKKHVINRLQHVDIVLIHIVKI